MGDDAGRVAATRAAAGPRVELRLDANGAWGVDEAVSAIEALSRLGSSSSRSRLMACRRCAKCANGWRCRVAIDETAAEHGALGAGVADAVCLKISRCGGIAGLLAAATLVRAHGAEVYLASTLDGPLGVAASAARRGRPRLTRAVAHCGLATLELFDDLANPLPAVGGRIAVPTADGLGVGPF